MIDKSWWYTVIWSQKCILSQPKQCFQSKNFFSKICSVRISKKKKGKMEKKEEKWSEVDDMKSFGHKSSFRHNPNNASNQNILLQNCSNWISDWGSMRLMICSHLVTPKQCFQSKSSFYKSCLVWISDWWSKLMIHSHLVTKVHFVTTQTMLSIKNFF